MWINAPTSPDATMEPALFDLTPLDEDRSYSLVVQCEDGWIHVFQLPYSGQTPLGGPGWVVQGYDVGNSRCVAIASLLRPEVARTYPEIVDVSPDVSGRVVRTLSAGPARAGRTDVVWDGRDRAGNHLPSGVYWARLRHPGKEGPKRIVLLR
jgi:hypothetical protein